MKNEPVESRPIYPQNPPAKRLNSVPEIVSGVEKAAKPQSRGEGVDQREARQGGAQQLLQWPRGRPLRPRLGGSQRFGVGVSLLLGYSSVPLEAGPYSGWCVDDFRGFRVLDPRDRGWSWAAKARIAFSSFGLATSQRCTTSSVKENAEFHGQGQHGSNSTYREKEAPCLLGGDSRGNIMCLSLQGDLENLGPHKFDNVS